MPLSTSGLFDVGRIVRVGPKMLLSAMTVFRVFTDVHPEFVVRCMSEIRVIDVNRHTLDMFGAPDKAALLARLSDVFRDDMQQHFREQLIDLWEGKLFQQREVLNYTLDGGELHVHMQFSVLPGYERDWSLVQVALTDITARIQRPWIPRRLRRRLTRFLTWLAHGDITRLASSARPR